MSYKMFFLGFALYFAAIIVTVMVMTNCSKHPHNPTDPDTVHVHHDHEIVAIDTVFQNVICDTFDLTVEFTVIGDQSVPNVYWVFLNDVLFGTHTITEVFPEPTEIKFRVDFFKVTFGDVITIHKVSGSRAEAIGSSIIKMECAQ